MNKACSNRKVRGNVKVFSKYDTIKEKEMGDKDDQLVVFFKIAVIHFLFFEISDY